MPSIYSYTLKDGTTRRWAFVIDMDRTWDATERRWRRAQLKRSGFPRRIDCERELRAEQARIDAHTAPTLADRAMTLETWLTAWLDSDPNWRPATRSTYTRTVAGYIQPNLGRHKLTELKPDHIRSMLARMRAQALSRTTVHMAYSTLRSALNAAIREQVITWNPCTAVKVEGPDRPEMAVWTPEQVSVFLAHAQEREPHLAAAYQIAAWRGLRRGELAGLRWSDIDLDAGLLRVERSVGYSGEVGSPKTARGQRTVSLGRRLVLALRAHQAAQPVRGLPPGETGCSPMTRGPGSRPGASHKGSWRWPGSCPCPPCTCTGSGTVRRATCS